MFKNTRGTSGMSQFDAYSREKLVCCVQGSIPVIFYSALDDRSAQRPKASSGILRSIDGAREPQAIKVALGEEPITSWAPLHGRDQTPVHIAADGVGMSTDSTSQFGGAQKIS